MVFVSWHFCDGNGAFSQLHVLVVDKEDTNLEMYFDECVDFIDEAKRQGGSVLVHCFIGKSRRSVFVFGFLVYFNKSGKVLLSPECFAPFTRSVTIVVAYLMKKRGMTLKQALEHVKSKRPVASPNAGFIRQLQDLEKSMQGMSCLFYISLCFFCSAVSELEIFFFNTCLKTGKQGPIAQCQG